MFLGQGRKEVPGHYSPCPANQLYASPCPLSLQTSRRQQKDKSARMETPAKGKSGAERPAGRGQGSGQTRGGLLACWATLRKPDHIRPQEFPGPVCSPRGSDRKPHQACSRPAETAGGRQPAIWDLLPGLRGCWPVLSPLLASRASSSV